MTKAAPVQVFAPAKINLTLHVTGQRADGYHLLDSLVVFADVGDRLTLAPADETTLTVTGPRAAGVPTDGSNLVLKAATLAGHFATITLDKHLPAMAGIGGGSSDAAAALRGLSVLHGTPLPAQTERLGADVPVCMLARAARMRGVGEDVTPLPPLPDLHGVLVNPGVDVPTPRVFARLARRDNAPMPDTLPTWPDAAALAGWMGTMRNDLEPPARQIAPEIDHVLSEMSAQPACLIARMSGSGATCFALTATRAQAEAMARALTRPGWWVQPVTFA
ncbi:4-(cytidine 5'-diphospho)-2-C-methyl-D-erythritol kinase [Pseudooceanicola onchidii]|uniref:4-(cytidine 5'-diphospho)-2-C-methyl-D-erythritol kinase n=1 Tax=Pseudooceanicola onchidii TaxID=2562279 RepID=UPI0010AABA8F|nr:4-(cytidine 5'-diphospho)-2-C-methyl-D-erythritol kinase [Pseudooceanicola onchidii]